MPAAVAAQAFVLIGAPGSRVTLTVAGPALGMMLFVMASGLGLVFGLMSVPDFGHSAFISFGAFIAASVLAALAGWPGSDSVVLAPLALFAAFAAAILFGLAAGGSSRPSSSSPSTATTRAGSSSPWVR